MRKFALVALITIATVACGQTASAPSTTVFGLELGKPFNVPECSLFKLGRKDYMYAENDKAVCYELNFVHHKSDPRSIPVTDGSVKLRFPIDQPVIGRSMSASIMKGNLEGIGISTFGIKDEDAVLAVLENKYGKPSATIAGSVQNMMGAQFPTLFAVWHFTEPDLTITYKASMRASITARSTSKLGPRS